VSQLRHSAAYDVAVLDQPVDLERLRPQWSLLADEVDARIFTRPEWCLPWWRHLGRGRPAVISVHHGGRLVALAPFHVRSRAGLEIVRFLGHGLGTIGRVLVAPGHEGALRAIWDTTMASSRRVLQLFEYEAGGRDLAALEARLPTGSFAERDVCPVIHLDAYGDVVTRRQRRLGQAFRRSERSGADGAPPYTVEVGRDLDAINRLIPEVTAVYDAAEANRPRLHLLRPPWRDFTGAVMREAAAADRLRIVVVRIGGAPAAFAIGLRGRSSMAYWLPRFDPAFARFSPGNLGILALTEESMALGLKELDFGLGDADYKRRWSTGEYSTVGVVAASGPWPFRLHRVIEAAGGSRRRWLPGRPTAKGL